MQPESTKYVTTPDGWQLEIRRYAIPQAVDPECLPLLFVPGYGMNTFVLAHHPGAGMPSMVEQLCRRGFRVWTANLRSQGGARRVGGPRRVTLDEMALVDIPEAIAHVCGEAQSDQVLLAGCSVGASLGYAYLAHHPHDHRVRAMVAIGGPLRWERRHALLGALARLPPALIERIPVLGVRRAVTAGLPWVRRLPALLSIYMNARHIDLRDAATLAQTVDNPTPHVSAQLARWVREGDLVLGGVNVTEALGQVEVDLLCVIGNRDRVVPPEAALTALDAFPDHVKKDVIVAGDPRLWFAHADLFISNHAPSLVFEPMATWLKALS